VKFEKLLSLAEAEKLRIYGEMPEEIAKRVQAVPVFFEHMPDGDDVASGIEPDTLGYFDESHAGMPRIRLWLESLWDYAEGDEEIFIEEVGTTLLHEIGHFLGWDEDDLEDRGLD